MRKNDPIVIAETDDYVAISKPSGMLTLPDRHDALLQSLRGWMEQKYGKIYVIHRLDKDTSGLILFAKNEESHKYYSQLFEGREVKKTYMGMVMGKPINNEGMIDAAIAEHPSKNGTMAVYAKGKISSTGYRVLKSWGAYSLLEFDLHTGRTHQIRVHSKYIGHPIACDPFYGDGKPVLLSSVKKKFKLSKKEDDEKPLLNRLALHSFRLAFTDRQGLPVVLEAPLPKDLEAMGMQLDKWLRHG